MHVPFANKSQSPLQTGLFSTIITILAVLIVASLTPASATAQAKIQESPSGADAIAVLGDRLSEVAESHEMTEARLRSLLLEDETLRVTPDGDLFYICPEAPDMPLDKEASALSKEAPFDLAETFFLHSNPGADHVLYIDFDGHTTTSPAWTQYNGNQPINSAPYDTDANPLVFSDAEREFIQLTWQYVVEDMLPFNIDVTTEEPPLDRLQYSGPGDPFWGVRVVVSATNFFGGGGVAFLGSFDSDEDLPAFVFNLSLASTGETVSHEAGHTFDLSHDGSPAGTYYPGHGAGVTSWGPLMGSTFTVNVSQWSAGEYAGANNMEDDLAIISSLTNGNGFGYRTDDHGDSNPSATNVVLAPGSEPVSGIVERNTDVDVFRFYWSGGPMDLQIKPFTPKPNLRVHAELEPESGGPITVLDLPDALDAAYEDFAAEGFYYLKISGTGYGTPSTGFSDYASLGAYEISVFGFQNAVPGRIYATQGYGGTGELVLIDPVTGTAGIIGNTGVVGMPGLAINELGEMYGVGGLDFADQNLYRIDAATGAVALIGDTGVDCLQAVTFEPAGRLLGIGNCGPDDLYQIDLTTGVATSVAAVDPNMVGLAFDPFTDVLYGAEWNNFAGIDNLHTIDFGGATTLVGSLGLGVGIGDIIFDSDGNLFGVVGGGQAENNFVEIDKTTGIATVIGPTGIGALTALATLPQCLTPRVGELPSGYSTVLPLGGTFGEEFLIENIASTSCVNLDWTIAEEIAGDCPWLTVTPDNGSTPPGEASQFFFQLDMFGLAPGTYTCNLVVTTNDPGAPATVIPVEVLVEGAVNPATAGVVYATQGYAGVGDLVRIDPMTGAASVIGNTRVNGMPGLAINDQGEMYGAGGVSNADQNLYRIDAATGAVVFIGETGVECLQALAFEPSGRLWGIGDCGPDQLYVIDLDTGAATPTAPVEPNMVGMAFDPVTGVLYGVEWNNFLGIDNLYTIDISGVTSFVGSLGLGVGVGDIQFDATGNLFGVVGGGGGTNSYVAINRSTGAATVIGPTGIGALTGLATFGFDAAPVPDIETTLPTAHALHGAYPNPFNPMTRISYELPADGHVTINVFDPAGRRVKTLVDGQQSAGRHELSFNAERLGSGVYFYEMRVGDFREVRKMTLLK